MCLYFSCSIRYNNSKGDEPMKNLFKVICKSIALSCVDLVKYYGVY